MWCVAHADARRPPAAHTLLPTLLFTAAGQSNAQFSVVQAFNGSAEIAAAGAYPQIRVFTAGSSNKARAPLLELGHIEHGWAVASAGSVGGAEWSSLGAQCWMTARRIADALGRSHPIGLLNNNYGGSTIGSWLSTRRFLVCNASFGEPPNIHGNNPTEVYNTFLTSYAVGPFSVKAVTWLQGEEEADLGYARFYPCAFPSLVAQFRETLDMAASAPGFVGVIAVGAWVPHSSNGDLAFVRDVQLRTALGTAAMGWATAADCGDATSPYTPIHFRDKETPSARLAASMLRALYGRAVAAAAPLFASSVAAAGPPATATLTLAWGADDAGPLALRDNVTCPPTIASEWCGTAQLQGRDGAWYDAGISLTPDGRGVVLTAAGIPPAAAPAVAATYGWMAWPLLTAYSVASGLPLMPFNCSLGGAPCWPPPPPAGEARAPAAPSGAAAGNHA